MTRTETYLVLYKCKWMLVSIKANFDEAGAKRTENLLARDFQLVGSTVAGQARQVSKELFFLGRYLLCDEE